MTNINFPGAFLVFSIIFNYISAVITDPGKPTAYDENTETLSSGSRYPGKTCKKCILPKPARTHHCSICRRCVLKMVNSLISLCKKWLQYNTVLRHSNRLENVLFWLLNKYIFHRITIVPGLTTASAWIITVISTLFFSGPVWVHST